MAYSFTDSTSTDASVKISGEDKITLEEIKKGWQSNGTTSQSRSYKGPQDQITELYTALKADPGNISDLDFAIVKGVGELIISYNTDEPNGPENSDVDPDPDETPEWNLEPIEIMRPLAAHPYFQQTYLPGAGYTIEQEIAKADLAIAQGEVYSPDASYGDYVSRYYALRLAGVEQYPELGLQLSKSYSTTDANVIGNAFSEVGRVVNINNLALPANIQAAVNAVDQITGYGTTNPTSVVFAPGQWEWVKRPTVFQSGGNENSDIVRLVEMYWGLDRWSTVIYQGTWDPPSAPL